MMKLPYQKRNTHDYIESQTGSNSLKIFGSQKLEIKLSNTYIMLLGTYLQMCQPSRSNEFRSKSGSV